MIEKVIMIIGLPGSGKTYLGNRLVSLEHDAIFMDDVFKREHLIEVRKMARKFNTMIVSGPHLCVKTTRDGAISFFKEMNPDIKIDMMFFENSPDKCLRNIQRRKDDGDLREVIPTLNILKDKYVIPEDVSPLTIWDQD